MNGSNSEFRFEASDGCQLAVRCMGPTDRPAIVLAHPIGFDGRFWNAAALLLSHDFHVILPDARGHGLSGRREGETSIEQLAHDILAVMDGLNLARASFAGCSLGGAVGMHLAARHGTRFGWFVLANAPARIPLPRERFDAGIEAARSGGYEALAKGMLARWIAEESISRRPGWYRSIEQIMLSTDPDGFADAFAALRESDRNDELGDIVSPVLVVTGEGDHAFPPGAARDLAGRIAGAETVSIADAAHLVPAEQPDAFVRVLREFARRHSP